MRNLFADLGWKKPIGSLQLIATLANETVDRLASLPLRSAPPKHLPAMPLSYLHLPVQQLGDFDTDLAQPDYTALGTALNQAYDGVAAFSLHFTQPQLVDIGVAVVAAATPEWQQLVAASRQALHQSRTAPLPEAAAQPGIMLHHAIGAIDETATAATLQDCAELGPVEVTEVALVSMSARPELGTFDYHVLANFELA